MGLATLIASCTPGGEGSDEELGAGTHAARPAPAQSSSPVGARDGLVSRYLVFDGPSALAAVRGVALSPTARAERVRSHTEALRALHGPVARRVQELGGVIVADLVLVANALQVRVPPSELPLLERLPGVLRLETPTALSPSLQAATPLIGAPSVWESGAGFRGEGVRVGVIDTGIDYHHAALGGSGLAADFDANDPDVIEAGTFPTVKVIGGKDLAGDAYDSTGFVGTQTPAPDDDPRDCQGHGTHVAAIAAGAGVLLDGSTFTGPYNQSLDPTAFSIFPGSAPAASIFAIKIGGCGGEDFPGESELLLPAFELAVDPDEDGDPSDRLDVVNLSFGYAYGNPMNALEREAVASLTDAGTLLVAAAGNDGAASFVTSFPASEPRALAVGATLKQLTSQTLQALEVTAPGGVAGLYPLGLPTSPPGLAAIAPFSGEAVTAEPDLACEPITNAAALAGKVALIRRGACTFDIKAGHAADAGAVAVLIVDNAFTDAPVEIGGPHELPTFRLRQLDGEALIAASPIQVSLDVADTTSVDIGPDYLAGFSSRGPTADRALLKPDVVAPGLDVVSAEVGTGSGPIAYSGTSMAAPLTAGAAALLRQAHPALGPDEIRRLLTSTAQPVAGPLARFPATAVGAGRISVDDALAADILAYAGGSGGDIGLSFGMVHAAATTTVTRTLVLENLSAASVELDLSFEPARDWPGMTLSVSPSTVVVPASGSLEVEVDLEVDPALLPPAPVYSPYTEPTGGITLDGMQEFVPNHLFPEASGRIVLAPSAGGPPVAAVAYSGHARASAERVVDAVSGCASQGDVSLSLGGVSAHHDEATSVLELGTLTTSFTDPDGAAPELDIVATGALASPDNERVYFGIVTAGDWVTPSRGYFSALGVEVDTTSDGEADFLVVLEAFDVFVPAIPFYVIPTTALYARVVDLETGQLSQTFEYVNGAYAAYPGGVFRDEPTHETHVFFNRVLVMPVELAALGLDPEGGRLAYRAVSGVSRMPLLIDRPMLEPIDTSEWVEIDAAAPRIALPGCLQGTTLCPGGMSDISVSLFGAPEPPSLLVLHHSNGDALRHEVVSLEGTLPTALSLAVEGGGNELADEELGEVLFTVTNQGAAGAAGSLSVAVDGGSLESLEADGTPCAGDTCEIGPLAVGEAVLVTARALGGSGTSMSVSASLISEGPCAAEPLSESAAFELVRVTPEPVEEDGCGCVVAGAAPSTAWRTSAALVALGALAVRRARRRRRHETR